MAVATRKIKKAAKPVTHDLPEELTEQILPLVNRSQEYKQFADQLDGKAMAFVHGWMIAKGLKGENIQLSVDGKTVTI